MLGEPLYEPADDGRYIDFQEAELAHFEQQLASEMCGYDIAPEGVRFALDQLGPKLEEARVKLAAYKAARDEEKPYLLAAYKEARNDVRDAVKRIARQNDHGGPPLD